LQSSSAYIERMTFSQKLTNGINIGLESALGAQAASSIGFFIDPRIAVKDPKKYWSNLDKMFNHNSIELKKKLIVSICKYFGIDNQFAEFPNCVEAAKAKFLKDDLVDPRI
jgi:hypothetical protein